MDIEYTHFHLFCGLGGGAIGFNQGHARVGNLSARFRCLGGVDSSTAAVEDFSKLAGAPGTLLDLFTREQYIDFHGHEPPATWREVTPADLHQAAGYERPNVVFTSPPCKGLTGLMSNKKASTRKYQALNALTLRGIWLALEAWGDDPPEFFLLENVPRIQTRGIDLLSQIESLLNSYGYVTARSVHNCGELGGLAQPRQRFLLVARHVEKVPPFLYEPQKRPMVTVGDVIEKLPLPGSENAGPMHEIPSLQWITWLRLAFIEAGADWRSLNRLGVEQGSIRDYCIVTDESGSGGLTYRVTPSPDGLMVNNGYRLPDIRLNWSKHGHTNKFAVTPWDNHSKTVTCSFGPGDGALSVSDPRVDWKSNIPGSIIELAPDQKLPSINQRLTAVIRAMDGNWHRPFTTLELAALQGLVDPETYLHLHGSSHLGWRERIGNAVPPPAAAAIASVIGKTLLLAKNGETFILDSLPVWVQPVALAAAVAKPF